MPCAKIKRKKNERYKNKFLLSKEKKKGEIKLKLKKYQYLSPRDEK
jgi:hypothetical protein